MMEQGIKITDLRAEVQTLVNSDPTKYDPNKNGTIEAGDELSQLLSEYQCREKDLTSDKKEKMWTTSEQIKINDYIKDKFREAGRSNADFNSGKILSGVFAGAGLYVHSIFCAGSGPQKSFNKKLMKKGCLAALGVFLCGIAYDGIDKALFKKNAKKDIQLSIKAKQTADGERIMEQRRKEAAELKAREEAMKKEELEYRERLNDATSGIERNINKADKKAKSVNNELDKIKEKVVNE